MNTEAWHSQAWQDQFVAAALPREGGVFVDIGAGHPFDGSNTAYLERQRGWQGLLCDRQWAHELARCRDTCATAQNTLGVSRVDALPPEALTAQIEAVVSDLPVAALKTGMLLNRALIEATAAALEPLTIPKLIDPVMVSRAGSVLLEPEAIEAYRQILLPLAELITPNLHEARLLSGQAIEAADDVERAAAWLLELGPAAVLIKGGGLPELRGRDYLLERNGGGQWLEHAPVETPNSHGSGCTLGAAITAERAKGRSLVEAVRTAKTFVQHGLHKGLAIGSGQGPLCHWHPLLSSHG